MNNIEARRMEGRIAKFQKLEQQREVLYKALGKLTEPWVDGPHGQGPFTGNTRESRQVRALHIWFSPTRGGSPEVEMYVDGMYIEAWEFGKFLKGMLEAKIAAISSLMEEA